MSKPIRLSDDHSISAEAIRAVRRHRTPDKNIISIDTSTAMQTYLVEYTSMDERDAEYDRILSEWKRSID